MSLQERCFEYHGIVNVFRMDSTRPSEFAAGCNQHFFEYLLRPEVFGKQGIEDYAFCGQNR